MLRFLPAPLLGIITTLLFTLSTIFVVLSICTTALFKFIIPWQPSRKFWDKMLHLSPHMMGSIKRVIIRFTCGTELEFHGIDGLKRKEWYLMMANHQSWADIVVLFLAFSHKIPSLRYFIKQQLIWVPFIGVACWALDFPFMQRHSKAYLKKHPEQKGKDIEATRRACQKYKNRPITLVNFVESTRFTAEKNTRQSKQYKHLLRPKSGGIAFALGAMEEFLHEILDVTIVYQGAPVSAWNFFCGRITKITVDVKQLSIPAELRGDYESDTEFRKTFQRWLNDRWQKKDEYISSVLEKKSP